MHPPLIHLKSVIITIDHTVTGINYDTVSITPTDFDDVKGN